MFKINLLVCLALSFSSGALLAWWIGFCRGPNISESKGLGGPIISGDPSLCDRLRSYM